MDFHLQRMMESYSPAPPLQVDLVLNMAVHSIELGTIWEVDKDHSYHRYPPRVFGWRISETKKMNLYGIQNYILANLCGKCQANVR